MRSRTGLSLAVIILILGALTVSQVACKSTSSKTARKDKSQVAVRSVTTTTEEPAKLKEEGPSFAEKSDVMRAFFAAFFSGKFESAHQITSAPFKHSHPFKDIEEEWRQFYEQANKNGLTKKALSYRTNFQELSGGSSGAVFTPSGRMLVKLTYKQLDDGRFKIDEVMLFEESLTAKATGASTKRLVLTKQTGHATHVAIRGLLIKEIAASSGIKPTEHSIKHLVVSGDWALAILGVSNPNYEYEPVLLQQTGGKWKIIDHGTGMRYEDHPETPYTIWAASDTQ